MKFQNSRMMRVVICAAMGCMGAFAQSGQTVSVATVNSSYPVPNQTLSGYNFAVGLGVSYPVGLSASSYVSGKQLAADLQGFVSGYPNPSDPPEAIFSTALSALLGKYSQIAAGALTAEVAPVVSGGVLVVGPTITVEIGTVSTTAVLGSAQSALKKATSQQSAK
ncbi:MAG TPA: hypothetical protein VKU19_23365 [Bryobacteraceae bacterium]|nr:hypothetical protein [Bryobacteraceae bacterium]